MFKIPELAPCQTTHTPRIPQMRKSEFRSRMEVKDRLVGTDGFESPVYDIDITYDYDLRLSRYIFSTAGFSELINYFGDTTLECVDDFNSDLTYCTDTLYGNCSVYSIGDNEWPASDVWYHGGIVSMKDPEWFWHIDDPDKYWYKGSGYNPNSPGKSRNIDSESWIMVKPSIDYHNPGYNFEWHFASENWVFYDGENPNEKYVYFHVMPPRYQQPGIDQQQRVLYGFA